jgi:hypothetical protein
MAYKNPKELMDAGTALPAAIEAKLPEGAPKLSTRLLELNTKLPTLPDFPVNLPDLPAVKLPEAPAMPTLGRRYVTAVEVRETSAPANRVVTPLEQSYSQPLSGVSATVVSTRGM